MGTPYAVSAIRELASCESDLLRHILSDVAPERLREIYHLKVIGRCGCGRCPTVIFGTNTGQKLSTRTPTEIANFRGVNSEGVEVGLSVFIRDDALSELEVWALDGGQVNSLPKWASMKLAGVAA